MKKCEGCGRETMDYVKFCEFCGRKFPEPEQENAAEQSFQGHAGSYESVQLPEINVPNQSQQNVTTGTPPSNSGMVWLILSSVLAFLGCFCYGLGILQTPSIIFGAISVSKYNKGEYDDAQKASKRAMILFFIMLAVSILLIVVIVISFSTLMGTEGFGEFVDEFY